MSKHSWTISNFSLSMTLFSIVTNSIFKQVPAFLVIYHCFVIVNSFDMLVILCNVKHSFSVNEVSHCVCYKKFATSSLIQNDSFACAILFTISSCKVYSRLPL